MHRLPDRVVAPEGEGNIADSPARFAARQGLFDFTDGLDELHRVPVVLFNARGHGQDVDVEDDILRGKSGFFGQKPVGPSADFHFSLPIGGLALLIKGHHDDRGSIAAGLPGLFQKSLLAFLKADRVHHRLALDTLQTGLKNRPFGAVQYQRHP